MKSNQDALRLALAAMLRIAAICIPLTLMLSAIMAAETMTPPPGTKGSMVYDGGAKKDTWWIDSGDGVNPGVPGCHEEVVSKTDLKRTGRKFGEFCKGNILVETTPGRGEVHVHEGDIGHPLLIDCNVWCQKAQKAKGGVCKASKGPAPCATSAICSCN